MSDLIDRQAVIDLLKQMRKDGDMVPWEGKDVFARIRKLPTIQPEKAQLSQEGTTFDPPIATDTNVGNNSEIPNSSDCISRQKAIDGKISIQRANGVEIYSDEAVPVEYLKNLPTIQPELDSENLVRTIENGITATNSNDAYSLGMRNGMRWCKSLIDGVEPKFEGMEGATT